MSKRGMLLLIFFILSFFTIEAASSYVHKTVLKNGLTILVRPVETSQKVSVQLWYHVGSKHEKTGEKGLAHLIEHMIFKGTEKLSESDIDAVANKLSASLNATTYKDWTRYYFNVPVQNFKQVLPIMADCMNNCTFKEELLNSELKAVVQELKMNKDSYQRVLIQKMIESIFPDHAYHFPVIGYKQDLWNMSRDDLYAFYKKHYVPNNAVMVIVGNVDVGDTLNAVKEHFESILKDPHYKQDEQYLNKDIAMHQVTMYRDVAVPTVMLSFVVPGLSREKGFEFDVLALLLADGKESRLHKKLVDELQLVSGIGLSTMGFFDHDLAVISFQPRSEKDIEKIVNAINEEIKSLRGGDISDEELSRCCKIIKSDFYDSLESNYEQASAIGMTYLATQKEDYIFTQFYDDLSKLKIEIQAILKNYMQPFHMHRGCILPFESGCKEEWNILQKRSDEEDQRILSGRIRKLDIEKPKYANDVAIEDIQNRVFPKPKEHILKNGIKLFYHQQSNVPKISLIMKLKANGDYDSDDLCGLYRMLCFMLQEGGTKNYTADQFIHELESRGMTISIKPGAIAMTMLSEDFHKGLELLNEVLTGAQFNEKALKKIRYWMQEDLKRFFDSPGSIANMLVHEHLYPNHQYSKNPLGTQESIDKISRDDLINFYKKYFSHDGAKISIVGDIEKYDIVKEIESVFGSWNGPEVKDVVYPDLSGIIRDFVKYEMNRDQIVLIFAGLSIDRQHEDYDKYLIFDRIFGSGMNSRLFKLRQKSGIFYTISGSLINGSGDQPGIVAISTIVSKDRLHEAQVMIEDTIKIAADSITDQEVEEAKRMILHSIADKYSTNSSIASMFLSLDHFGFPFDYSDTRADQLKKVTTNEIKQAVKKILNLEMMKLFYVGRVDDI